MKKTIVIYGFTLATMIFGPAIVGENNARSQAFWIAFFIAVVGQSKELFCSGDHGKVCKYGQCLDAACISFRKHCNEDRPCSNYHSQ